MKRIFTLLVLLAVVVTGWAQVEIDGIAYNLDSTGKTAVVTSNYNTAYEGDIVIPASVTNEGVEYAVTSIGDYAFYNCSGLTSVAIPNSVTIIKGGAFQYCYGLTSVDIPNSVMSIGSGAFSGCIGLTSVDIPNSVTSLGGSAFYGCYGLTSVDIPSSVTSIESNTFYGCRGLTSMDIPNSVTSIGSGAFDGCSGLTSVTIPNSVTSIGSNAFSQCSGLTSVTIPNSVTSIGDNAFRDCSGLPVIDGLRYADTYLAELVDKSLTRVTIKDGTRFIGGSVFYGRRGLASVTIPNSVTSIGDYAFDGCSGLTSVIIPNSVTSIGNYAFRGCSGLTSVTIPNSVTSIGSGAFRSCIGLTSVTIGSSVTSIGAYAFNGCPIVKELIYAEGCTKAFAMGFTSITSVTIPNSVTSIEDNAFRDCRGLTSVDIPNSVTSIGNYAFWYCDGLTSVTIPNSVTSIGESAFAGCSGLPVIDGLRYADTYLIEAVDRSLTDVTIKEGTRLIGNYAFSSCGNLTWVTIPNSVISIGAYAFNYCRNLTSVTIPNSVTSIGERAFYDCYSLVEVTIGSSVTSIGNGAFDECYELFSVTNLAETPQDISWDTFCGYGELHVLPGCGDAYSEKEYWNWFWVIEDAVLPSDDIALVDGQVFKHNSKEKYLSLTYTRNFNNTEWQALYVPFAMSYEDWADDFEVLRLNDVHQYDDDDNGTIDRTELEAIKVKSGSIEPNTPYLIRAKEIGEKVITLTDVTLYPATENKFDVTSWNTKFTFTGTYSGISGTEMKTNGYYAMGGGTLARAKTESANLGAFRWYLSVTDRMGNPKDVNEVKVTVFGLDWDDEETAIEGIRSNVQTSSVFDMSGRKAQQNTLRSGLYIKNGKKYLVK